MFAVSCKIDPEFIHRNHIGKTVGPLQIPRKKKHEGPTKNHVERQERSNKNTSITCLLRS